LTDEAATADVRRLPAHRVVDGFGRALCRQPIARAVEHGATAVTLNVYPENGPAVALYERLGFRRDESRPMRDSLFMRLEPAE